MNNVVVFDEFLMGKLHICNELCKGYLFIRFLQYEFRKTNVVINAYLSFFKPALLNSNCGFHVKLAWTK